MYKKTTQMFLSMYFFSDLKPVCHNNGTVVKESDGVYSCQCTNQYTGSYCESGGYTIVCGSSQVA